MNFIGWLCPNLTPFQQFAAYTLCVLVPFAICCEWIGTRQAAKAKDDLT